MLTEFSSRVSLEIGKRRKKIAGYLLMIIEDCLKIMGCFRVNLFRYVGSLLRNYEIWKGRECRVVLIK
jgi:hypothetical protein